MSAGSACSAPPSTAPFRVARGNSWRSRWRGGAGLGRVWGLLKNTRNCRVLSVVLGVSILTATALTWFCRALCGLGELLHAHEM